MCMSCWMCFGENKIMEKKHDMRVFLLEQLIEMFKCQPCLYKALQIASHALKSNRGGHNYCQGLGIH